MEASLRWSEAFSVGHDELDEEHRRLVKAVNDVCDAYRARKSRNFIYSLLKSLERETEKHLQHENAVMLEICADTKRPIPDEVRAMTHKAIEEHIAEHKRNLIQLRTIMRAASPNAVSAETFLCMELRQWFLDHAIKYDSGLKAIFQAI
jgi:hemerythrin